jgi:hypothetical protein
MKKLLDKTTENVMIMRYLLAHMGHLQKLDENVMRAYSAAA